MANAYKNKGYLVPSTVKTLDIRDEYPVADVNDIAGARHIVQTDADRLAIPKLRRKVGMECYVADTGMLYMLTNEPGTNSTTLNDWTEEKILTAAEVANFVTTANLTSKLANYAKISDLPNMSQYATLNTTSLVNYYKKSETYTKTEVDTDFVKKADLPEFDKIVVELKRPDIVNVNYNYTLAATDPLLPTTIDVTYADGSAASLPVAWDVSTYAKNVSGLQVILGTLNTPTGTKNAIVNVVLHIMVGAETHVIKQILSPTVPVQITAKYDQPFSELPLPTRMQVEYEDNTTAYLDVDWTGAASSYDPQELAAQNLTGAFLLPANVTQPASAIEPTAEVLARVKPLNIISDATMTVPLVIEGTLFNDANFPTSNTVTLEDNSTTVLDIKWNKASYNPFAIGKQYLTGEYVLVDGVLNENDVTPGIIVEVGTKPDICDVIDPPSITTGKGVNVDDLLLPTNVAVKILAYDGTITNGTATVNWIRTPYNESTNPDGTTYDKNTVGDYYILGEVIPPTGVTNLTDIITEILVKVIDGVTYVVTSVPTTAQTLPNGSTFNSIKTVPTVDINIKGSDGSTTTDTVNVVWDSDTTPVFDGTTAGTYTLKGTLVLNSGVTTPDYQNTGDLKATIVVTVEPPAVVKTYTINNHVNAGSGTATEGDTISSSSTITLPNQVQVEVLCSDGTTSNHNINISAWNLSNIDSDSDDVVDIVGTARTVELQGQFDLSSIVGLSEPVTNPNGYVAKYNVAIAVKPPEPVTHKIIDSLASVIPDINLNYNAPASDLTNALAAISTVDLNIKDPAGNITVMTGVAVTWDVVDINNVDTTSASTTYQVRGDFPDMTGLADPVYNDKGFRASVNVIIGAAPVVKELVSYEYDPSSDASIIVNNGTVQGDIIFPTTIKANCTEGGVASTHTLPITSWTFSTNNTAASYDGNVEGDYKFTPTIDASSVFDHTGTPTIPDVNVHVNAALVPTTTYLTSEFTIPMDTAGPDVFMTDVSNEVFNKLVEIATNAGTNNIEDAWMGELDDDTGQGDLSKRIVEFRYMGTAVYPITGGVRIPSEEDDLNAFHAKLASLGIPDGTFSAAADPNYIVGIEINYTESNLATAKSNSRITFHAGATAIAGSIIQIRVVDQGAYIDNDPNSY